MASFFLGWFCGKILCIFDWLCSAGCATNARGTSGAGGTSRALCALNALMTLRAGGTLSASGTLRALRALNTLDTLRTGGTLGNGEEQVSALCGEGFYHGGDSSWLTGDCADYFDNGRVSLRSCWTSWAGDGTAVIACITAAGTVGRSACVAEITLI